MHCRRLEGFRQSQNRGIVPHILPLSIAWQSDLDRDEAIAAGREAVRAALAGETAVMEGFRRLPSTAQQPFRSETFLIPMEEVMLKERILEEKNLLPTGDDITKEFENWCKPLIGGSLSEFSPLH